MTFDPPLIIGNPSDLDLFTSEDAAVGERLTPSIWASSMRPSTAPAARLELYLAPGKRHRRLLPDRTEDIVHVRTSATIRTAATIWSSCCARSSTSATRR